jgi:hypothetical protein
MTEKPAILDAIKSRVYWHVVLRPHVHDERRVALADLPDAIRKIAVLYRGWAFPHVNDRVEFEYGENYVQQAVDLEHHREFWRVYQSGQFVFFGGEWTDWRDRSSFLPAHQNWKPMQALHVLYVLFRLTEVFEFCSRWATSPLGDSSLLLKVSVANIKGCELLLEDPRRAPLMGSYRASTNEFKREFPLGRDDILVDAWGRARGAANELFQQFGWKPGPDLLKELQDELHKP